MTKRFAVIGLGLFGRQVAVSLAEMGAEVIAIDKSMDLIEQIKDKVMIAVQLNSTDRAALEAQEVASVDAAVVGIGNFEECLLTLVLLKQMGVPRVVARAATFLQRQILEQLGCEMVVLPEEMIGLRVANSLASGIFLDQMEIGDDYSIVQLKSPHEFVGRTLVELKLRETYRVNLVTIKRREIGKNILGHDVIREKIHAVPRPDDQILENDILVVFGHDKDVKRLTDMLDHI